MVLPLQIHDIIGEELQTIYLQVSHVTADIRNACPLSCRISRIAGQFTSGLPCGPLYDFKDLLECIVIAEHPNADAGKLYNRNGQPGYHCPELLIGIPVELAERYADIQKGKIMRPTRKKPGLKLVEILAISLFLTHCEGLLIIITSYLERYYSPDHKVIAASGKALEKVNSLRKELVSMFLEIPGS